MKATIHEVSSTAVIAIAVAAVSTPAASTASFAIACAASPVVTASLAARADSTTVGPIIASNCSSIIDSFAMSSPNKVYHSDLEQPLEKHCPEIHCHSLASKAQWHKGCPSTPFPNSPPEQLSCVQRSKHFTSTPALEETRPPPLPLLLTCRQSRTSRQLLPAACHLHSHRRMAEDGQKDGKSKHMTFLEVRSEIHMDGSRAFGENGRCITNFADTINVVNGFQQILQRCRLHTHLVMSSKTTTPHAPPYFSSPNRNDERDALEPDEEAFVAEIDSNRNHGDRVDGPWIFGLCERREDGMVDRRFHHVQRRD
ncbi:hypothetical protein B566_EDAN016657 [Ephemera danica]|nr:hypothetical protein B566_EDAN016657 [Ephemera danica]